MVELYSKAKLPTRYGDFDIYVFRDDSLEHVVLFKDYRDLPVLVRIHSKCMTGDLFGSLRCDCGFQLGQAMSAISQVGGLLIYLDQEGRGIGLANKIKAYALQDKGYDTADANLMLGFGIDERDYAPAASILEFFKIRTLAMLTNNPRKIEMLRKDGFEVYRTPITDNVNSHNANYLNTKKQKMGHDLVCGDCDILVRYREIVRQFASRTKSKRLNLPKQQIR